MSSGYRTQLAIWPRPVETVPLEGEPIWDSQGRKLGFYNFAENQVNWFRIPTGAEGENYVPQHQWTGTNLRFRNSDGTWGNYTDLGAIFTDIAVETNTDGSLTFTFSSLSSGGTNNFQVTTDSVKGDPGPVPNISFDVTDDGELIITVDD